MLRFGCRALHAMHRRASAARNPDLVDGARTFQITFEAGFWASFANFSTPSSVTSKTNCCSRRHLTHLVRPSITERANRIPIKKPPAPTLRGSLVTHPMAPIMCFSAQLYKMKQTFHEILVPACFSLV